jgi:hypothetical protein
MRVAVRSVSLTLLATVGLLATGCFKDGEEGKSCAFTRDCMAGLVCEIGSSVCRKPADVPPRFDAAVNDAVAREASVDTATDSTGDRPAEARPEVAGAERPVDGGADAGGDGSPDGATGDAADGGGPDAAEAGVVDALASDTGG